MYHSDRLLETAREHLADLRLEAGINRELQSLRPQFNLRRRLACVLRKLAAQLESDTKTATLG